MQRQWGGSGPGSTGAREATGSQVCLVDGIAAEQGMYRAKTLGSSASCCATDGKTRVEVTYLTTSEQYGSDKNKVVTEY
jgi:phage protein U